MDTNTVEFLPFEANNFLDFEREGNPVSSYLELVKNGSVKRTNATRNSHDDHPTISGRSCHVYGIFRLGLYCCA